MYATNAMTKRTHQSVAEAIIAASSGLSIAYNNGPLHSMLPPTKKVKVSNAANVLPPVHSRAPADGQSKGVSQKVHVNPVVAPKVHAISGVAPKVHATPVAAPEGRAAPVAAPTSLDDQRDWSYWPDFVRAMGKTGLSSDSIHAAYDNHITASQVVTDMYESHFKAKTHLQKDEGLQLMKSNMMDDHVARLFGRKVAKKAVTWPAVSKAAWRTRGATKFLLYDISITSTSRSKCRALATLASMGLEIIGTRSFWGRTLQEHLRGDPFLEVAMRSVLLAMPPDEIATFVADGGKAEWLEVMDRMNELKTQANLHGFFSCLGAVMFMLDAYVRDENRSTADVAEDCESDGESLEDDSRVEGNSPQYCGTREC